MLVLDETCFLVKSSNSAWPRDMDLVAKIGLPIKSKVDLTMEGTVYECALLDKGASARVKRKHGEALAKLSDNAGPPLVNVSLDQTTNLSSDEEQEQEQILRSKKIKRLAPVTVGSSSDEDENASVRNAGLGSSTAVVLGSSIVLGSSTNRVSTTPMTSVERSTSNQVVA